MQLIFYLKPKFMKKVLVTLSFMVFLGSLSAQTTEKSAKTVKPVKVQLKTEKHIKLKEKKTESSTEVKAVEADSKKSPAKKEETTTTK